LGACASSKEQDTVVGVDLPIVWPPSPNAPRVVFVKSISAPDDLGIKKGFFSSLANAIFGDGEEDNMIRPMAIVANGEYVYVADTSVQGVHRYNPSKNEYELIKMVGDEPLLTPVGLALGNNGDVYVADSTRAQIFVIKYNSKIAEPLKLDLILKQPTGIAVDKVTGRLFVADTMDHRIHVFNTTGSLVQSIGERGDGAGQFNFPTLLSLSPQGEMYVTDSMNFRVQIFDVNGKFRSMFGKAGDGAGDASRPKGVATDSYGHVYLVDSLFNAIQVFDKSGKILLSVGSIGNERGQFWLPTGIFIGEGDLIYVADSYNRRVQVLRYIGGPT